MGICYCVNGVYYKTNLGGDKMVKSERFSLKGWDVWVFLKGNFRDLKNLLKFFAPAVIAYVATYDPEISALVGVVGKALFDVVEYFVKKY